MKHRCTQVCTNLSSTPVALPVATPAAPWGRGGGTRLRVAASMWPVTESGIDPEVTGAQGVGLATVVSGAAGPGGRVLDTWFPAPELVPAPETSGTVRLTAGEAAEALGPDAAALLGPDDARGVEVVAVRTMIGSLAAPPADAHDAYLRLHLLSGRLVRPRGCNLD